jgi:chemotaxis protein methyltransferase WspC
MTSRASAATAPLARLAPLLARWIGLDTATVGNAAIERACRLRMEALGIDSLAAYVDRVAGDDAERTELIEHVVVGESWFFRDQQVFEFLRRFVRGRLSRADRLPIRILSAPCAGGEEPYSAAMALLDAGVAADHFAIEAVDVSRAALQRAAAGRYSANAFRNADLSFRDRWFQPAGGASVIDPRIRRQVRFHEGNLLDEDCVARLAEHGPFDVLFCRNLLIYLDDEARTTLERTFDRLLASDGVLLLGAAEPPIMRGRWIPAAATSVFALERGTAPSGPATASVASRPREQPARTHRGRAAARPQATATAPGPVAPPPTVACDTAPLDAVLREAGELANAGRFTEAIAVCDAYRERCGPAADVFFLMGMLHQSAGDVDSAAACFHKTLYLKGSHADAFLALALIAAQRGDAALAETYRQSAVRAAARGGNP